MMNTAPYPYIEFSLSIGTWDVIDFAYLDTGFEGGLLIPVGVGREVLASPRRMLMRLPDEDVVRIRAWTGILEIEDHRFTIEVAAMGSRYLLGREVLDQMEVCFEFGRRVRLRFGDESGGGRH